MNLCVCVDVCVQLWPTDLDFLSRAPHALLTKHGGDEKSWLERSPALENTSSRSDVKSWDMRYYCAWSVCLRVLVIMRLWQRYGVSLFILFYITCIELLCLTLKCFLYPEVDRYWRAWGRNSEWDKNIILGINTPSLPKHKITRYTMRFKIKSNNL